MLKPLELISHEALEGWTKKSTMDRNLRDSSDEEVDVVRVGVDQLQPLHNLLRDEVGKVVEAVGLLQAAHLTPRIVARQSVVPTSLDVQGDQVHPEAVVLGLEEMVGQLLAEDVVELLPGLGGQPDQEAVKSSRAVHELRVEEGGREWDAVRLLAVVVDLFHQAVDIVLFTGQYLNWISRYLVSTTYSNSPCTRECPNLKAAVAKLLTMEGLILGSYLLL